MPGSGEVVAAERDRYWLFVKAMAETDSVPAYIRDMAREALNGGSLPDRPDTPLTDRLRELKPGWDTYGAVSITDKALKAAEGIERSFALVPLADGGFQVEIHGGGIEVEVEFNPEGEMESTWVGKASR